MARVRNEDKARWGYRTDENGQVIVGISKAEADKREAEPKKPAAKSKPTAKPASKPEQKGE